MKPLLKAPIAYYGGKTQMSARILPLIPQHSTYCEPFFGSGAIFFAKEPSKVEIINDTNNQVINFYRVAKRSFPELLSEIDCTLHSEYQHSQARQIYRETDHTVQESVPKAWSLYVLANQSYLGDLENTWAYGKNRNLAVTFHNKKTNFNERYMHRLERTQIFCRDALKVIKLTDTPETFFFVDPPYFNSDCGHYDGYSKQDFINLLEALSKIQGKFLLTSYPSEVLDEFKTKHGWHQQKHTLHLSASAKSGKTKTEVITTNYPI